MTTLIACLSTGKGTWSEVIKAMNAEGVDKVFLVTNSFGKDNFKTEKKNVELVVLPKSWDVKILRDSIIEQLKGKIDDNEVLVNFVSGDGREHMALISALLKLGFAIRLVTSGNNGIEEL